ncbi:hypothetical protein DPMN_009942 [Dreissena polymorpha]|uniref:Uncharacterized protein n=1 Tax=Dreissena polymorpha TaxID=45954 RepID=A0A9D4S0H9_DREPO|nr:hypothetical protein DPMN_009942 [Dreissena polymorpha]
MLLEQHLNAARAASCFSSSNFLVWLNAPNAEKCRRPELDYCATLGDTLTLETITAVGKHFRMPTILEGFNEQRTPMSRVCTVRQELCGQIYYYYYYYYYK